VILEFPSERGYFSSMKPQTLNGLETRLTHFLEDLLEPMGRRERRHWARVYVQGLLLDGERKSIELMASRIVGGGGASLASVCGTESMGGQRSASWVTMSGQAACSQWWLPWPDG
jgi:hypothetical protein